MGQECRHSLLSQGCNQGWLGYILTGRLNWGRTLSKPIHVFGRTHFLVALWLRSLFCYYWKLEGALSSERLLAGLCHAVLSIGSLQHSCFLLQGRKENFSLTQVGPTSSFKGFYLIKSGPPMKIFHLINLESTDLGPLQKSLHLCHIT